MGGSIMASSINASTSGVGGVITTADATGILNIQTAGVTAVTVDASQNVGIGTTTPDTSAGYVTTTLNSATNGGRLIFQKAGTTFGALYSAGANILDVEAVGASTVMRLNTNGAERIRIDANGNVGIGMVPTGLDLLELAAGTATKAPLGLTAGTLLSAVDTGSVEYDGVVKYFTCDTTSGRGYVPTTQFFRLTANGTAFGPAIGNFFGANSAINLAAGGEYEIEAYCYFTKTTAGTVTVTATTSLAPANLSGVVQYGAVVGGTATGAANQINLFNSTATGAAFGASGSLTTAVNHLFIVKLIVEANASASNLRINFTSSAGTVTPLRTSYYKVTKLPPGNTGSFAA